MGTLKIFALTAAAAALMSTAWAAPASQAQSETMRVEVTENQIDEIGSVIYSQIRSKRANRTMRMTLLVPRTAQKKPAIIYFPGAGFTSADCKQLSAISGPATFVKG